VNIHPKRITENGREYVRIPAKEYQHLLDRLEEAEDIRDAKAALRRVADGEETLPADMVHRLIDATPGERIAIWRKHRGLTRDALAKMAKVSGGAITMIETGKRQGRPAVLRAIADALGCDLDELI